MSFIGIVCTPKQEGYVKQVLQSNLSSENIIILKEDNIENFKNITFETIAIFSSQINTYTKKDVIVKIMKKAKYFVINADELIQTEFMEVLKENVITYGFNSKSTVTASSVKEDSILICLQRTIETCLKKQIEPQEILISTSLHKANTSTIMGIISILFVYGKQKFQIK